MGSLIWLLKILKVYYAFLFVNPEMYFYDFITFSEDKGKGKANFFGQ